MNKTVHNSKDPACGPCVTRIISTQKGIIMIVLNVLNAKQYASLYPSEKFAYDNCTAFVIQDWTLPRRAEVGRTQDLEEAFAVAQVVKARGGKPMVHAVAMRGHEECFCFIPDPKVKY